MSHLKYNSYPGFGERVFETAHYSTAVRILPGERVEVSGQGGWDRDTDQVHSDLEKEIQQAFDNVHHALVSEGGPGMPSVYKFVVYLAPMTDEARDLVVMTIKSWFPNHRPLLTVIGVEKLALPGMRIEVEAGAHLG